VEACDARYWRSRPMLRARKRTFAEATGSKTSSDPDPLDATAHGVLAKARRRLATTALVRLGIGVGACRRLRGDVASEHFSVAAGAWWAFSAPSCRSRVGRWSSWPGRARDGSSSGPAH